MDTSINIGCFQPQVLSINLKKHAEKFVKGFGGNIYSFKEAMEMHNKDCPHSNFISLKHSDKGEESTLKLGKWFFLATILMLLTACGGYDIETNMSRDVEAFEFTTQSNETLSNEDLEGEWWIADMIFTNCTTVCLPMTTNMSTLQDKIQEENLDVQLVSFSVDPDYDTPEVLTEYAETYEADLDNWTFLTGYDFDTIKEISIRTFQSPLIEPPEGDDQVTHGTRFYLVNPEGKVIKGYDGVKSAEMDVIMDDLRSVVDEM